MSNDYPFEGMSFLETICCLFACLVGLFVIPLTGLLIGCAVGWTFCTIMGLI